ncbi:MAG: ribosome biogenesis GTPase YlqF [Bacilli bacterium]|nr:ribosome biogenesis GTPase YlqF [Bacilli bacterium]
MKKALNEIEAKIKLVDVIIEILDARAPLSSINPEFEKRTSNKKKLIVVSKSDLADPNETKKWEICLKNRCNSLLILNLTDPRATKIISDEVQKLGEEKHQKEKAKGMKPQPIKAMIIGVPNVGKSSLINRIAKRNAAGVQNKPGYTRGEQYIKVNKDFILLDTPGVLPMNYEDKEHAINLALIGSIREEILPNDELVKYLLKYLKKHYPNALKERFDIDDLSDPIQVSELVAKKRGLLTGGEYDLSRADFLVLKEFKEGKLGRITLEQAE